MKVEEPTHVSFLVTKLSMKHYVFWSVVLKIGVLEYQIFPVGNDEKSRYKTEETYDIDTTREKTKDAETSRKKTKKVRADGGVQKI